MPNADHVRIEASLVETHEDDNVGYNTRMRSHCVMFCARLSPALVSTSHDVAFTNASNDTTARGGNIFTPNPKLYVAYVLPCSC